MTAKADATLRLRAFEIDDLVLFEVLDAATGARVDAAYAGTPPAGVAVTVGGTAAKRRAPSGSTFGAGVVDLGRGLPRDRSFRLRVSALDDGGSALVSDVLAEVAPATSTFVLAGNPEGTASFDVDDDVTSTLTAAAFGTPTSGSRGPASPRRA